MSIDTSLFTELKVTKNYAPATSLSLAVVCELAYEKDAEIKRVAKFWGFPDVEPFSRKKGRDIDTQCFAMSNDTEIVVAFRGTDTVTDWLANVQIVKDPGPLKKTNAHEGFQDALFPTVIAVTDFLTSHRVGQKRLWVTGHSLGGALCSLYSGMLIENGFEVYGLYTFASPRPATDEFAQQLNSSVVGPHWRIVNHQDVVPHVPPEPFFSHPGNRVILKEKKRETSSSSWLKQRKDALVRFVKMTGQGFKITENHTLNGGDDSYIPRLKANQSGWSRPNAAAKAKDLPKDAVKRRRRVRR